MLDALYFCSFTAFRIFDVAVFPAPLIFANSSGTVVFTPSSPR